MRLEVVMAMIMRMRGIFVVRAIPHLFARFVLMLEHVSADENLT
jgi:hypothetical protein